MSLTAFFALHLASVRHRLAQLDAARLRRRFAADAEYTRRVLIANAIERAAVLAELASEDDEIDVRHARPRADTWFWRQTRPRFSA